MTTLLEEAGQIIGRMSRPEKAQVLQWVVSDLGDAFPGIDSRPDHRRWTLDHERRCEIVGAQKPLQSKVQGLWSKVYPRGDSELGEKGVIRCMKG